MPTPEQTQAAAQGGQQLLLGEELQGRQDGQGQGHVPARRRLGAFAAADQKLRAEVEAINDKRALEKLAAIEQSEGKKTRYYVEALMIKAKGVLRAQDTANPDLAAITQAIADYEESIKGAEQASAAGGPRSARSS